MKYLAITLLAFFGPLSISATSLFEDNKQAEDEARLFYNNNGNMYMGLNATYIWGLAGLAAVGVAAVILYFAIAERASGFASGYNRFGEDYAHQNQNDFYQTEYETRQKRFANGNLIDFLLFVFFEIPRMICFNVVVLSKIIFRT